MHTFSKAIQNINNLIFDTYFKERFRSKPEDFTRNRSLTFETTIFSIFDLTKKSLQIGLNSLSLQFNFHPVSKQAFSLARQKISYIAFKALNEEVVRTFYENAKIKLHKGKYLLLAIDGSTLYLPQTEELSKHFSKANNGTSEAVMARTSILYDALNKIILDVQLVSYNSSEKEMFLEHIKWLSQFQKRCKKKIVLLLDAGYPCVGLFLLLRDLKIDFVCCAHSTKNKGIIDQLEKGQPDGLVIAAGDTTDKRRSARTWLGLGRGIQIPNWECKLRAVRSKGKVLLTSLVDHKKFKIKEIFKLYKKRWEVETAYRTIKIDTLVENFSGKKLIVIYQEVNVTVLIQNLARIYESDLQNSNGKKGYFINHREILGILKVSLQLILIDEGAVMRMATCMKINWERSLDNRYYPRKIISKAPKHRATRLCYA